MANAPIFQVWKLRPRRSKDEGLQCWGRGRCQDSMGHSGTQVTDRAHRLPSCRGKPGWSQFSDAAAIPLK